MKKLMVLGCLAAMFASATLNAQAPAKSAAERSADSALKAGNSQAALKAYQQLAERDSTNLRAWYGIGTAAYNLHQDALSARAFERAAADGKNVTAMYNAGSIHARLHHTAEALRWLDQAVTAGFAVPSVFATDSDLTSLHGNPQFEAIVKRSQIAPSPCLSDSNSRRFDFWVGEWNVTQAKDTTVVGHSVVQIVSNGCALLENWMGGNGGEGKSLNSYNAKMGHWEQFWVGPGLGGATEYRESHWDGPTLVLQAHSDNLRGAYEQRLSFTPIDANTVRQFGELSFDGGKTWSSAYDFYYHRKK